MKTVVTGLNGTVAPVVARRLTELGCEVVGWDRAQVSPDDAAAVEDFLGQTRPEAVLHLATGSPAWAAELARICRAASIRLLFTSSVSVFGPDQQGPFDVDAVPGAQDDYGRYKRECESLIAANNPAAIIARLGWQIGNAPGSNNMFAHLQRTMERDGRVEASVNWFPACSFLQDTADELCRLATGDLAGGIYHLDGNPGCSFYEIAQRLNALHGTRWRVVPVQEPAWNSRMLDARVLVRPITERL